GGLVPPLAHHGRRQKARQGVPPGAGGAGDEIGVGQLPPLGQLFFDAPVACQCKKFHLAPRPSRIFLVTVRGSVPLSSYYSLFSPDRPALFSRSPLPAPPRGHRGDRGRSDRPPPPPRTGRGAPPGSRQRGPAGGTAPA